MSVLAIRRDVANRRSFINTLNPIIMLFDPHLHTFEHIHDKSRFLYVVIASAAKPDG